MKKICRNCKYWEIEEDDDNNHMKNCKKIEKYIESYRYVGTRTSVELEYIEKARYRTFYLFGCKNFVKRNCIVL
jgi:hypothetical protein